MYLNKIFSKIDLLLDLFFIYYLKLVKGFSIGENCKISRKISVKAKYGAVTIGDNCILEPNVRLKSTQNYSNKDYTINILSNVFIGYGTVIDANHYVEIGENSMIGPYVFITDSNHILDVKDMPISSQGGVYGSTVVGRNVWIGSHAQVLKSVVIGNNSIIAANSTLITSQDEESLIVGIPAKTKKKIF